MSELRLREVMNTDSLIVARSDTLTQAASVMRQREMGSAIVMEHDAIVGILTERDLERSVADGVDPTKVAVEAYMTADPVVLGPDAGITQTLDTMLERKFRHIPVVEDGRLLGVVSFRALIEVAKIRHVDPWAPSTAKGLENVPVAETELSWIDGQNGVLIYRGYNAVDLAENCSFEDVWHLLYYGELPTDDSFERKVSQLRELPVAWETIQGLVRQGGNFMSSLQAAISASGAAWGIKNANGRTVADLEPEALRISATVPVLVAALWRALNGQSFIEPDPSLGMAANYIYMITGEKPNDEQILATNRYLILTAEHGMNASTFTSRVIASTEPDVVSAVAGAAGALAGPLHGGAPSLVLDMMDAIGTPDNAKPWIEAALTRGERIMGFGHRVYRTFDPRSVCLKATGEIFGGERIALAVAVEQAAIEVLQARKPGRALFTNVEFYSSVVMERAGIPRQLFTPTFAVSRTIGWTSNVLEQLKSNRIIRPTADYVGPRGKTVAQFRST